jgi:diaminopimelate epimerase
MISFLKMHGAGNDFVIIDTRTQPVNLSTEQIKHICNRNFGVGCDQLVTLQTSQNVHIAVTFYNPDGSQSDACGNATRCVADIILNETGNKECKIETGRGILKAWRADNGQITVDMGEPVEITENLPLENAPTAVNMGNPHCVFFVDDVAAIDLRAQGAVIENNTIFPNRTNVEYVQIIGENKLRQRTWERGAGETLACGSGACAVAVAAITKGLTGRTVEITLDGGTLLIEWRESDKHVLMTGPVATVFEGKLNGRF